jgi:hypothetical protein
MEVLWSVVLHEAIHVRPFLCERSKHDVNLDGIIPRRGDVDLALGDSVSPSAVDTHNRPVTHDGVETLNTHNASSKCVHIELDPLNAPGVGSNGPDAVFEKLLVIGVSSLKVDGVDGKPFAPQKLRILVHEKTWLNENG